MVGRLSPHDREAIAKTIVALSNNDKKTTASILRENGYAATFRDNENVDDATLHDIDDDKGLDVGDAEDCCSRGSSNSRSYCCFIFPSSCALPVVLQLFYLVLQP